MEVYFTANDQWRVKKGVSVHVHLRVSERITEIQSKHGKCLWDQNVQAIFCFKTSVCSIGYLLTERWTMAVGHDSWIFHSQASISFIISLRATGSNRNALIPFCWFFLLLDTAFLRVFLCLLFGSAYFVAMPFCLEATLHRGI